MNRKLYGIYDKRAGDFLGPIWLHRHEAAAIRFFGDVASDTQSIVHKHIEDYYLLELAEMDEQDRLTETHRVIITGSQWAAAQQPRESNVPEPTLEIAR